MHSAVIVLSSVSSGAPHSLPFIVRIVNVIKNSFKVLHGAEIYLTSVLGVDCNARII